MTECPLNSECVNRNYCNELGFITTIKINDLSFEEDKRELIVGYNVTALRDDAKNPRSPMHNGKREGVTCN